MQVTDDVITIVVSTFEFVGMEVANIVKSGGDYDFIVVSLESIFVATNVNYSDSDIVLFNLRSSQITASGLHFSNIMNARYLFETYDAFDSLIATISAVDVVTTSSSLINFKQSVRMSLSGFVFQDIDKIVIETDRSQYDSISELRITNVTKAMEAEDTVIEILEDSQFTRNGGTTTKGGALKLYNCEATLGNNTFTQNSADVGAAIHFD